jgi:xylan 1,4-beta-xylosidase
MGISHELRDVDQGFALIESFPEFRHLPVILSEADPEGCAACSAKMNPANAYRNGTLYPAYTAAAYARMFDLAKQHEVKLIAMLSWAFEFEGRDTFEGFRSLATNGIDKPVLNFFRMAAKMTGERVQVDSTGAVPLDVMIKQGVRGAPDVNGLATVSGHTAWLLMWNYEDTISKDKMEVAQVALEGLPDKVKRVQVREWKLDSTHGNAYTAWQAMGSPVQPIEIQKKALQRAAELREVAPEALRPVENGSVRLTESLEPESLALVSVSW